MTIRNINAGPLVLLPRELTIEQKFRLVEIAHETKDHVIREWAISILEASCPNHDVPSSCTA